jgi:hypothetical protein
MYIDVLEFENRHFRRMFEGLTGKLRKQFSRQFAELQRHKALGDGVDPAVGFTAIYMQFFNYFLVEKLFGGNRHFGISDDEVVNSLSHMFCRGIVHADEQKPAKQARKAKRKSTSAPQKSKSARK